MNIIISLLSVLSIGIVLACVALVNNVVITVLMQEDNKDIKKTSKYENTGWVGMTI